jgi:hypothetical protein
MKHVQLFEQFITEEKSLKKIVKQLKKDGYAAWSDGSWIYIDSVDVPDGNETVDMAWNPGKEEAYSNGDTYKKPIKSLEDFLELVDSPEDTKGMWESTDNTGV